ncbi:glycine betaine ABC transporter substrate-binding protein [Haloechinothrix sp. LS1_15]|uniref:glycine betaine ABC transporter substrate-binding protein n=1 Tax=Haloechinothrix sp. LS1_15 TaxID=2652248 RepID=UPI00294781C8|nr:glycine betaine ABC transporter substrate-binding protein [Haloechinothrix sp. LS1_15]MDV6013672.1 glycine betaine ABC transporter substrate-binding protein [Haloechinothrix sp. LS1_15]
MRRSRLFGATSALLAGALVLSACAPDDENDVAEPEEEEEVEEVDWGECDTREGAAAIPDPDGTGEDETEVTIGIFSGWDESYASVHLFEHVLEDMGYTVDTTELEAGATYTGVARGDIDFTTDGWLPVTHEHYLEEHGDNMESLGCWYDNAKLTFAVNEDAPIDSIDELAEHADEFDNRIVGIEPGAGLTSTTEEEVIPTYGLEEMEFLTSSTPAMLSELQSSIEADENVVVTLWHPHWAYDAFPIRDLEDPEGTLGETEIIYNFGRDGFEEDYPNLAQMVRNFVMEPDELAELERIMFSEDEYDGDDHEAAVADWLEDNPEFVEDLKAGTL